MIGMRVAHGPLPFLHVSRPPLCPGTEDTTPKEAALALPPAYHGFAHVNGWRRLRQPVAAATTKRRDKTRQATPVTLATQAFDRAPAVKAG